MIPVKSILIIDINMLDRIQQIMSWEHICVQSYKTIEEKKFNIGKFPDNESRFFFGVHRDHHILEFP